MRQKHVIISTLLIIFVLPANDHCFAKLSSDPIHLSSSSVHITPEEQETHDFPIPLLNDNNFRKLVCLGAGVFLANRFDNEIDKEYALEVHQSPFGIVQSFARAGNLYDNSQKYYVLGAFAATAVGYSLISGNKQPAVTVGLMIKSLVVSSVITFFLKTTVGRHRPYTNQGPNHFEPFEYSMQAHDMSFPSGHTSSIFALMTVLAERSHSRWVKIPAYSFATSVALQRIIERKHWASDVIIGGIIGYLVGHAIVKRRRKEQYKKSVSHK